VLLVVEMAAVVGWGSSRIRFGGGSDDAAAVAGAGAEVGEALFFGLNGLVNETASSAGIIAAFWLIRARVEGLEVVVMVKLMSKTLHGRTDT
jgi:hypothetical protein